MLKEIQFQRSRQTIYAMDEDYNVIKSWPCHDDFLPDTTMRASSGSPCRTAPIPT